MYIVRYERKNEFKNTAGFVLLCDTHCGRVGFRPIVLCMTF